MKGLKEDLSWDGKIKRLSESVFKLPIDYNGYRLYRNYIGLCGQMEKQTLQKTSHNVWGKAGDLA